MSDLERQLAAKLETGAITNLDADTLREFAQFLEEAGPPPGQPGADTARYARAYARLDPDGFAQTFLDVARARVDALTKLDAVRAAVATFCHGEQPHTEHERYCVPILQALDEEATDG